MHVNLLKLPALGLLAILISASCQQNSTKTTTEKTVMNQDKNPEWLQRKITAFEQDKPANPPVKIYRYLYHFQEVYYITGRSGDIPSEVYTLQGQQLCQPDGGITGRGDGKCPDFFESRTDEKLVWEDNRN